MFDRDVDINNVNNQTWWKNPVDVTKGPWCKNNSTSLTLHSSSSTQYTCIIALFHGNRNTLYIMIIRLLFKVYPQFFSLNKPYLHHKNILSNLPLPFMIRCSSMPDLDGGVGRRKSPNQLQFSDMFGMHY